MDDHEQVRHRTVDWQDPTVTALAARERAGLDLMQAVLDGDLPAPPIGATIGFSLEAVEPGRAVFAFTPAQYHYNPIGSVHGGVYATLLDSAAGCAVHTMLPAGVGYTSLDLGRVSQ